MTTAVLLGSALRSGPPEVPVFHDKSPQGGQAGPGARGPAGSRARDKAPGGLSPAGPPLACKHQGAPVDRPWTRPRRDAYAPRHARPATRLLFALTGRGRP